MSIPDLTMREIRAWVDGPSLEKGMNYFNSGCVSDGRREGPTLKARCEGSRGTPYRVWVRFKPSGGIEAAHCSCPVGTGRCKHVAALLLTWQEEPGEFPETASVDATLAGFSREQLVTLIRQMIREQPDLESLLRTPLPVPGEKPGPLKPETYQRQAKGVFDRAGDEWGVEPQIADALEGVIEIGDAFADAGDHASAAVVYEGVATEVLDRLRRHEFEDEDGDLLGALGQCVDKAAALLPKLGEAGPRERVLRLVFDLYRYDLDAGGIDAIGEAYESLFTATTPEERRALAEWARAELKRHNGWAAGAIGSLLLDLEGENLDDEAFLRVCRDTGRIDDLVDRLLKLGRVDEGADELRRATSAYDLTRLADQFVGHGHGDVAEGVVLKRLRGKPDPSGGPAEFQTVALLEWLKRRAAARPDPAELLSLSMRMFDISPSRELYDEIKALTTTDATWESTRPTLLSRLAGLGAGYRDLLVRIHLDEGRIDDALALVRPRQGRTRAAGWGWGLYVSSSVELDVAKAAEKSRPDAAIGLYRGRAEALVAAGGRENYREACKYLKKVRTLHRGRGAADQWDRYVNSLRQKHTRLRALREEMAKAGI